MNSNTALTSSNKSPGLDSAISYYIKIPRNQPDKV